MDVIAAFMSRRLVVGSGEGAQEVLVGVGIAHIVRLVVGGGLRVVFTGAAFGIGMTVAAGHWLGPLLFGCLLATRSCLRAWRSY
jgi:hypothetical protein